MRIVARNRWLVLPQPRRAGGLNFLPEVILAQTRSWLPPVSTHASLHHGPQLGYPHGEAFHRDGLDASVAKRVTHETVTIVPGVQGDVGDGGKFGFQGSLGGDAFRGVSEKFGVGRGAGDGERLHESARAVAAVAVVEA